MKIACTLHKTLKWQSVELQVRGTSSHIMRRAIKSSNHFGTIVCLLGIGTLCLTFAEFVDDYFFIFTIFAYCPNLVTQFYETPDYEPLFTTKSQIDALHVQ